MAYKALAVSGDRNPSGTAARGVPARVRVALFCPTLGEGGADRIVSKLLRELDRSRFTLDLAVLTREGPFAEDLPADVQVHQLAAKRVATAAPELARYFRALKPDVVFSIHGAANIMVALAHAMARSKARLVLSERSALDRDDRGPLRRALEVPAKALTYRRADLVIAVSSGVADDLQRRLGLARSAIEVLENPIVDDELLALSRLPCPHPWFAADAGVPVILAVGRLVAIKDYPTLLGAFARVRAQAPVRLVVLGEGPERASIEEDVRRRGLGADVALLGFDKNPFRYMARAALLLHASRAEGSPGALIQAMACGLPVVATDCDHGPREVITQPGTNGFLLPLGDAAGLASASLRLLGDESLRRRIGEAAQASVARFASAAAIGRYEAALLGAPP